MRVCTEKGDAFRGCAFTQSTSKASSTQVQRSVLEGLKHLLAYESIFIYGPAALNATSSGKSVVIAYDSGACMCRYNVRYAAHTLYTKQLCQHCRYVPRPSFVSEQQGVTFLCLFLFLRRFIS